MCIGKRKYIVCVADDGSQAVPYPTDMSFSGGIKEPTAIHGSRYRQNYADC